VKFGAMNHPGNDLYEQIRVFKKVGFDFIDLTLEPPATHFSVLNPREVKRLLLDVGLELVCHTAYYIPIASPIPALRVASFEELKSTVQMSADLGATIMNVHYCPQASFMPLSNVVGWHVEVLRPLSEYARDLGITVVLENVAIKDKSQYSGISDILNKAPLVGMHLDIGHAQIEGGHLMYKKYLDTFSSRIKHIHISDNNLVEDQHIAPTDKFGADWPRRVKDIQAIGYDSTITLEIFPFDEDVMRGTLESLKSWL